MKYIFTRNFILFHILIIIKNIILVAKYKNRVEYSMNKAGKEADDFINHLKELIC